MAPLNGEPAVVLLAEDDPGDQELIRRAFEESKMCPDLHVVNDGEEALDYLLRRGAYADPATSPRPHLVLLDLNMPKVDGKQVLEQIRAHPRLRRTPVVVLTTSRHEEDIRRSYDLGVNSYVAKPLESLQFSKLIHGLEDYWFHLVMLPPDAHADDAFRDVGTTARQAAGGSTGETR